MTPLVFLLVPTYALADRFAGGGSPKLDDMLPGRAAFWGALLCAIAGYFLAGWPAAAFALGWLVYRTPKWRLFGNASITPVGADALIWTFNRHALTIIPAFIVAKAFDLDALRVCAIFAVYALVATVLAAWYGQANAKAIKNGVGIGNENVVVELLRGAAFGLAVAVALY
jgi:hypothetical protein